MHVGFIGPSGCGKTTLAQHVCASHRRAGWGTLACDPLGAKWDAHRQTDNAEKFLGWAQASRNCKLFIDEAGLTIDRDRAFQWLFVTARHHGHQTHVMMHDASQLLPVMRKQLSKIFLFRCHRDDAETWARQFCHPEIAEAVTLGRHEFLVIEAFAPVRRCKLKL